MVSMNVPMTSAKTIFMRLAGNLESSYLNLKPFSFSVVEALTTLVVVVSTVFFDLAGAVTVLFDCADLAVATFLAVFLLAMFPPLCTN